MRLLITWTTSKGWPMQYVVEGATLWVINSELARKNVNFHKITGVREARPDDKQLTLNEIKHELPI